MIKRASAVHQVSSPQNVAVFGYAERVARLPPWQRRLLAFAAGIGSVLAMPPFHLWPVLWLTLPIICLAADAETGSFKTASVWSPWRRWPAGRAAEIGWWFGFGYHIAGLFWIGEAFLVEAEVFAWLLPFAVTLLPAGLAFFTAFATASMYLLHNLDTVGRMLALAVGFGVTEWLRGHILTGFPWNVLGTAVTWPLPLMQSAAYFGIYGLTLLTVLIFAGPFALLRQYPSCRRGVLALGFLPLLAMYVVGTSRLAVPSPPANPNAPRIRVVQASVPQRERLQPQNIRRIFDRHLALSLTAPNGQVDNAAGITAIVWPEAAMPFLPLSEPVALEAIGALLPKGTQLISGALRLETDPVTQARKVYNSVLVFDGGNGPARLAASYDKAHLVPFGEYLPLQPLLELIGLQQLTRLRGGFAAGSGSPALVALPGLGNVLPLICYEVIFPQAVQTALRPDLVLTITNDGWFGNSTGPRQHYHQARIRAVEMGIPMLRASSNGISSLFDGHGRELGRLELNAVGTLDVTPPQALRPPVYSRFGDWIFLTLIAATMLGIAWRTLPQKGIPFTE